MDTNTYERKSDWASYRIHESKTGYVVTFSSQVQGSRDGLKILVPFSPTFPQGMKLGESWNESTSNGDAISHVAKDAESNRRILNHGILVQ